MWDKRWYIRNWKWDRNKSNRKYLPIIKCKKIETLINKNLYCSCIITDTVDDFVEYYCKVDNAFEILREMKSKYKQSKKKSSPTVNEQCIGLATLFEIRCSSCESTAVAKATEWPFKGKYIRDNPSHHTASH